MHHFRWLVFHVGLGLLITVCAVGVLVLIPPQFRLGGVYRSKTVGRDWMERIDGNSRFHNEITVHSAHEADPTAPTRELPVWASRLIFSEAKSLQGELEDPATRWAYGMGVPFPCLGYVQALGMGGHSRVLGGVVVRVPGHFREDVLPYTILPLGMVANVGIAALITAATGSTLASIRSAFRRRRGRCMACGYSRAGLAGGAVCPECGASPRR